jgi:hypothetical protein
MIVLEAVRAAVLSDKPWSRLDELVRAELAAGQRTKQIYESLAAMADAIDDTPGLTDDGSDAFGDVLDALTGMCHPDCQYKDSPNTTLPTEDEIAQLPRRARVAFAARCARRVWVLYRHFWADAPEVQVLTVALAVESAELVGACDLPPYDEDVTVAGYAHAAHEADLLAAPFGDGCYAAATASFAGDYAFRVMNDVYDDSAYMAASTSVRAAETVANLRPLIRRDFDHLAELARWQKWTDDTPVPPEVFGPLWPDGLPKGWPVDESLSFTELPLQFLIRNGTKPGVSEDEVVNLFNILNQSHIARTGVRLTLEGDIYTRLAQLVGVGV